MAVFTFVDYLVLLLVMIVLASIGIYFRFSGGKQSSVEEYLLGDRAQAALPVALSLVSSHMTGVAMLGIPAEVYYRGAIYAVAALNSLIVTPITAHLILPVFFSIGSPSQYQYLELRFGRTLRVLAALLYPLQSLLYLGVVLYAPALALQTLSDISLVWSVLTVGLVCTFYSALGGIKAVIITDVIQFILSCLTIGCIVFATFVNNTHTYSFWKLLSSDGRLNFSNFSLDLTERHTWWSLVIGCVFMNLGLVAVHQSSVQRYLTLRDYKTAVRTLYLQMILHSLFSLAVVFAGLCIYFHYRDCDPFKSGRISSEDQLVPVFILDTLSNIPGLPGLAAAGIFSASLSAVSVNLNSLAAVAVQDYVQPLYLLVKGTALAEADCLSLTKVLVCVYGGVVTLIAFWSRSMAGMLQTGLAMVGLVGGPMFAVFALGMFVPLANEKGSTVGLVSGILVSVWLNFGGPKPPLQDLQTSIKGCSADLLASLATNTSVVSTNDDTTRPDHYFYLYRLSYLWLVVISCITTLLVGFIVSLCCMKQRLRTDLDSQLFSPPVAHRLKLRETRDTREISTSSRL